MKLFCPDCDPKCFTIYGFCGNCKRKCECPLYEPKSKMSLLDYEAYKKRWYEKDLDSFLEGFGRKKT